MTPKTISIDTEVDVHGMIHLNVPTDLPPGRVVVTLQLGVPKSTKDWVRAHGEFVSDLRARQAERGYEPPTKVEFDASVRELRDEWDDATMGADPDPA